MTFSHLEQRKQKYQLYSSQLKIKLLVLACSLDNQTWCKHCIIIRNEWGRLWFRNTWGVPGVGFFHWTEFGMVSKSTATSLGPSDTRQLLCHCYITLLHTCVCKHVLTHPDTANTHLHNMHAHTHTSLRGTGVQYTSPHTHTPDTTHRLNKHMPTKHTWTHEHLTHICAPPTCQHHTACEHQSHT